MVLKKSLPPPGTVLAAGVLLLLGLAGFGVKLLGTFCPLTRGPSDLWGALWFYLLPAVEAICYGGMLVVGCLLFFRVPRSPQWGIAFSGGLLALHVAFAWIGPGLWFGVGDLLLTGLPLLLLVLVWWSWRRYSGEEGPSGWGRKGILGAEIALTLLFVAFGTAMGSMLLRSANGREYPVILGPKALAASRPLESEALQVRLPALDGEERLPWREGSTITLVDFWATWCLPCRAQMPEFARLQEHLKGRGVEVVLVHVGEEEPDTIRKILEESGGAGLTCLLDKDRTLWERTRFNIYPSSVLLGAEGEILGVYEGRGGRRVEMDLLRHLRKAAAEADQVSPAPGA